MHSQETQREHVIFVGREKSANTESVNNWWVQVKSRSESSGPVLKFFY